MYRQREVLIRVVSLPRRTSIHTVLHTLWILWRTLWIIRSVAGLKAAEHVGAAAAHVVVTRPVPV
jgi:hypothetical protein